VRAEAAQVKEQKRQDQAVNNKAELRCAALQLGGHRQPPLQASNNVKLAL
jgi:hypothetical protein